jgi:predicted extracellular nuclease
LGSAYTQNFDTLSNTAGSTTNNLTLSGWLMTETGGGARDNEQYAVDTGGSTTGDTYSYGAAAATDRALGGLRSGTLIPNFGAAFTNNTGATINSLAVAYTGEEWRFGTLGRADQINFEYSTNATDLTTGTWTNVAALNFVTPDTASVGAKNGNAAADRTALSSTITGLSIPNGATFWIRWTDIDVTGADDGLAVDDFSITPNGAVALPNLTINDVSLNEGNAGTTSFTFTVSLSAPAGPGGVTFDIATADGTATQPSDYTQKSLTSQTIPAGSSTYSFTVLVNGDTSPETNETFFVNVTNVTGATVTDGQGQGTIVNDDAAPNLTINDVSLNEGNAGTTTFTFTVSLSAPAGAGGVTFDIATANNSAVAPGDYTAKSLTSQTIPAGNSTYTFDVLVNGDTAPELDESFFVNITNITNAIGTDTQGLGTIVNDDLTRIHDVQGNGAATPIPGATVSVEGVVVANFQGSNKLSGFFLQEEDADADADPATSEGIFIFCSSCPTAVAEGQRVRATGTVSEFNNMTEITASTGGSIIVTDAGNHLAEVTPTPIDLPIAGDINTFYEAREGMRVTFVDSLTVAEYFELGRYGQIELFEGGRPRQFSEMSPPSVAGYAAHLDNLNRRRVILDDDNNAQNWYLTTSTPPGPADGLQFVYHPRANGGFSVGTQGVDFFRGGDLVNGLTGVLHWSFSGTGSVDAWRIRPTAATPANFTVANPRPATPPAVGGAIKAVSMNLLNYFTTIDTTSSSSSGPCGPSGTQDCRGADSVAELNRQRERASIVICALNADVYALMELENTTPSATITDLLGAVNARCGGVHPYAFVNTGGTLGTDAIRVQLIYRTGIVSPVGSPLVDLDPVHNRPPTAQTFDVVDPTNPAFGQRFTVIANHFKSKGCPGTGGDADANDGQGCFNATRTAQATRLLTWINSTVLPAAGDLDVLLLGDFNSYAQENPVTTLTSGGFTDVETALLGANAYSYLFDGQLGHLDYAFASASLFPQITGVGAWHINADESDLFDYNDEVKDVGEATFEEKPDGSALVPPRVVFQPASPYRASDHDPVMVGLFPPCVITCPANVTVSNDLNQCGAVVNYPAPTTSGTCANITCSPASSTFFPVGTTTVTCSDNVGGGTRPAGQVTGPCSFTVTVNDTQMPSITCPANITVTEQKPGAGAIVNYATPTPTDNCPNPTVSCVPPSGSTFPAGTTTVTCTATDASNNMANCSFTVTVNGACTITCPANITVNNTPGQCGAVVNYPAPQTTGTCGTVTCTPSSGSSFPLGTTTVTCTASTGPNCMFTVTVNNTDPIITCPANITQSNTADQCGATVNYPAPTVSPCVKVTVSCTPPSGSFFPKGTTTVTCTATDGTRTASCMFTVTINDTQPPVITCPANQTRVTTQPGGTTAVVNYPAPTVSDNCPGATVVCSPASGSTFPVGTTTVSCTATDTSGNTATCSFTVSVANLCLQDDANPSIVVLANTQTGEYRFCCNGSVFTGKGKVTSAGGVFIIEHIAADRRVLIKMSSAAIAPNGTASLQSPPGTTRCTISDRDTRNNSCICQ